jgi:peroxiredoxin
MNKIHQSTTVGLLFALIGIGLFYAGYSIISSLAFTGAYFLSIKEVSKYTSWYQFSMVFISAILIGVSIEYPYTSLPLITLALFVAACGSILRIVLFKIFSYTQHSWFEPLMMVVAGILYILGNIVHQNSWNGWVFPLPIMGFNAVLSFGIMKDKSQLLSFSKGGYRIETGKPATEFELPDQDGNMVRLSDFKGVRHLLLIFVRGDWCPGCHMMLRTYEKNREKFQQKNVFVMAIGPDPVGVNKGMVEKLGVEFKVLADDKQRTAMNYGIQLKDYDNDFAEKYEEGIPLPASFLIDKNGIVRYVSRPDKVGEFLNPSLIFPIVEKLG